MRKSNLCIITVLVLSLSAVCANAFDLNRVDKDLALYDQRVLEMKAEFSQRHADINDKSWVLQKLSHMVEVDQYMRNYTSTPYTQNYSEKEKTYFEAEFAPRFESIDVENTKELKKLLKVYRWFTISAFGLKADNEAWLLVQHADTNLKFQKSILKVLKQLYLLGETNKSNYAYLYDRVKAIGEGKLQLYGTQGKCVGPQKWEPHQIEDPENVDKRRKEMGMVSMSVYKTWFKDICKESD
jgi:hypothetical protein